MQKKQGFVSDRLRAGGESLILGGAAVYRCGQFALLILGFSP
jgi:hypothetical protein